MFRAQNGFFRINTFIFHIGRIVVEEYEKITVAIHSLAIELSHVAENSIHIVIGELSTKILQIREVSVATLNEFLPLGWLFSIFPDLEFDDLPTHRFQLQRTGRISSSQVEVDVETVCAIVPRVNVSGVAFFSITGRDRANLSTLGAWDVEL